VPWWQHHAARIDDKKDRAAELAGIRQALHTEVGMVAMQCLIELDGWLKAAPPPAVKNPRTARLPSLTILEATAGKIGLLTRDEIVHLIGFAGTLHDISVAVEDMIDRQLQGAENRQTLTVLLSNACGNAAKFLEAVPGIESAEKDRPFIEELKAAHKKMDGVRLKAFPSFRNASG
jgi:hypothetical protein